MNNEEKPTLEDEALVSGKDGKEIRSFEEIGHIDCYSTTAKICSVLFAQFRDLDHESMARRMICADQGLCGKLDIFVGTDENGVSHNVTGCFYSIADDIGLEGLTGFDRAVFDSICSLLQTGHSSFTLKQILDVMAGRKSKNTYQSLIVQAIKRSVEKMAVTRVGFDWSGHAALNGLAVDGQDVSEFTVTDNLLYVRAIFIKLKNGQFAEGYELLEPPPLYVYAATVRQIAVINPDYLTVPGLQISAENIELIHYIARWVKQLKNPKNRRMSNEISVDRIFSHCGIRIKSRRDKKTFMDRIYKILEYYTLQRFIDGYEKILTHQAVTRIKIILTK